MELHDSQVQRREHGTGSAAIVPTAACVNEICHKIENLVRGTKFFPQHWECQHSSCKAERLTRTLIELGGNPDISAIILVGPECQTILFRSVSKAIGEIGKFVGFLAVREISEIFETANWGARTAIDMVRHVQKTNKKYLFPSVAETPTSCCPGLKKCMNMLIECGRNMSAHSPSRCPTVTPFDFLCEIADRFAQADTSTTLHEAAQHSGPEFWEKMGVSEEYASKEFPALKQWLDTYRRSGFCDHIKTGQAYLH